MKQFGTIQNDEEQFCRAWINQRQQAMDQLFYWMAVIFCIIMLATLHLISETAMVLKARQAMYVVSSVTLVFFLLRGWKTTAQLGLFLISYVTAAGIAWVLYHAAQAPVDTRDVILVSIRALAFAIFTPLICPYRPIPMALYAVGFSAMTTVAAWNLDMGYGLGVALSLSVFAACAVRMTVEHLQWEEAKREFRFRLMIIPEHFARPTAGKAFAELFTPEEKFCVCLSSDWRGYQELCNQVSPDELTRTISSYYDSCKALLHEWFPHGNYFSDWIADELFIAIFPVDAQDPCALADHAMDFAMALLKAKGEFAKKHALPRSIDIGIAAGKALMGLMGPDSYRKTTALGAVPSRARRTQGFGKMLRRSVADVDHIIFGADFAKMLSPGRPFGSHKLSRQTQSESTEDLEIYFKSLSTFPNKMVQSHG